MLEAFLSRTAFIHKLRRSPASPAIILPNFKEATHMGFRLKVEGQETIELGLDNIQTVIYDTDTPDDSNARSTDVGSTLRISGKIITAVDGDSADDTLKLALWSLVPAEKADSYRKVTLEVIAADQVVRKIHFPNAFVVDYNEHFGDTEGVGAFTLYIKQKKDKTELATIDGGYPV
jgi:hypothetical protein